MIEFSKFDKQVAASFKTKILVKIKFGFAIKYSIKVMGGDIRIKRYLPQACRWWFAIYLMLISPFFVLVFDIDMLKKDLSWQYKFDAMAEEVYYDQLSYRYRIYENLDEAKEVLGGEHGFIKDFSGYFYGFLFFSPVLYIFLGSRGTPIAVNKKNRLIYTWYQGRLFYHKIDSKLEDHNLIVEDRQFGEYKYLFYPLKIKLRDSIDPCSTHVFTVGAMPDPCMQQF